MLQIAEYLPPTVTPLWKLSKQAGVDYAVGGLPFDESSNGADAPWDYLPLLRMQQRYQSGGFHLAAIEARPPLNNAERSWDRLWS
jgi:mannonate dehydratase